MHSWTLEKTPDGDLYRCRRHPDVGLFSAVNPCRSCSADPGDPPGLEADAPAPPPPGCLSTEELERRCVAAADQLGGAVDLLIAAAFAPAPGPRKRGAKPRKAKGPDYHLLNAIGKLADTRAKYLRAAGELARNREHETLQRERDRRDRELGAGRRGVAN